MRIVTLAINHGLVEVKRFALAAVFPFWPQANFLSSKPVPTAYNPRSATIMLDNKSKRASNGDRLGFEAKNWATADAPRSNVDAAVYKRIDLGLIL